MKRNTIRKIYTLVKVLDCSQNKNWKNLRWKPKRSILVIEIAINLDFNPDNFSMGRVIIMIDKEFIKVIVCWMRLILVLLRINLISEFIDEEYFIIEIEILTKFYIVW